jgi:hypothetical protein
MALYPLNRFMEVEDIHVGSLTHHCSGSRLNAAMGIIDVKI